MVRNNKVQFKPLNRQQGAAKGMCEAFKTLHTGDFFPYPIFYFIFEDFSDGGFPNMAWKVIPHFGA